MADLAKSSDKYAIIFVNGHQHEVKIGDSITVHKLLGALPGDEIALQKLLLVGSQTWTGKICQYFIQYYCSRWSTFVGRQGDGNCTGA